MARRTLEKREAASRHARIHQMAAQQGRHLPDSMRAASAASLREAWRWALEPVGEDGEMLVLFNHAGEGARDRDGRDADIEVRAAIMHTSFGRGLYVTGTVKEGQNIGWYDGQIITERQYNKFIIIISFIDQKICTIIFDKYNAKDTYMNVTVLTLNTIRHLVVQNI